jgi:nicotinate-nucleotide adenylyltransferase
MVSRIGILGGTFDPIHNGHIYLAKKTLKKIDLDKIILIPTYLTPHKTDVKITPAIHRYNMTRLAVSGIKGLEVSDMEIKRKGHSYSVDTLRSIRKKAGEKAEIFFITGSDSLKDMDKWKDLDRILEISKFIIVKRPGFALKHLRPEFIIISIKAKNISASDIRNRVKEGRSITSLVPKKVQVYIKNKRLYLK